MDHPLGYRHVAPRGEDMGQPLRFETVPRPSPVAERSPQARERAGMLAEHLDRRDDEP
jgi:hypothetical protein